MSMTSLSGKTAPVTGASRGIGRASALAPDLHIESGFVDHSGVSR
jgi:NADP-dependent 3-hydroxy acid dehydrogenase YdfG